MTEEKRHSKCVYFQSDGMFGMWCDIHNYDWVDIDANKCKNRKELSE